MDSAAPFVRRSARRLRLRASGCTLRTALIVALANALALGAPGAVLAHNVNTAAGHQAEDAVVHSRGVRGAAQPADPAAVRLGVAGDCRRSRPRSRSGRAVGAGRRLARRRHSRGSASERQSARLGLRRRCRDRDLPRSQFHASHRLRPDHGHTHTGNGRYGFQHLLRRFRPPLRRFALHRRRQQERATRRASSRRICSTPQPTAGASGRTWPPAAGIRRSRR